MRRFGDILANAAAEVGFWWRNSLTWSLPAWKGTAGSWDAFLGALDPPARERALALRTGHDLDRWPALLTPIELQENLYLLDVLERLLPRALPDGPGLDIGSKNGAILPALVAASARPWDLVELDAHRRYLTGATRRAHGERMAAAFPGTRYLAHSVTDLTSSYAVITWFLPFVHEGPLRAWGLPRRFFAPEKLLRHVAALLAPGGALIVVNQGESERNTQSELFTSLGLSPDDLGRIDTPLSPFHRPRYAFRWQRPQSA